MRLLHKSMLVLMHASKSHSSTLVPIFVQHVQGIAIDAARSNVDYHYIYICDAYKTFMQAHTAQVLQI